MHPAGAIVYLPNLVDVGQYVGTFDIFLLFNGVNGNVWLSFSVGLLLDTGHCLAAGVDPLSVLSKHGARICHLHCKDVRPEVLEQALSQDMGFMEAVLHGLYTVPGDGCIDYSALLHGLRGIDYRGWLVVEAEQDPAKANPLQYARMGYNHLCQCARQAGYLIER